MAIALVFAGGVGVRMNARSKPKQFLSLYGKPILIHTLEHFENHKDIDSIALVYLKGWEDYIRHELEKNFIKKVKWLVVGGSTVQESTFNGLEAIYKDKDTNPKNTIVLIHDGVRPLIDNSLITDNIESVKKYGTAISVSYATETVTVANNEEKIENIADRSRARIAKAPQSFYLEDIMKCHKKAREENIDWMIDSASLMNHYGFDLHTVMCSNYNIKITTPSDYYIFRALYEAKENSEIFGIER